MTSNQRIFDGIICFGGADWWYHNRGHYDMQMCRELSTHIPVLYVNSIGLRIPKVSEGSMFARRVLRKLASLRRGFVSVRDRFAVLSPISIPGRASMPISRYMLAPQILGGARRMGIRRPLVWVTCPAGVEAVTKLRPVGVVYQRTDRWESFPESDPEMMLDCHHKLQQMADLTLFCSTILYKEEKAGCRYAAYVDHGVDFDLFEGAGRGLDPEPADIANIPRPRVGFIGSIDALTFDPALFEAVARCLHDVNFVLVGSCSLSGDWTRYPNVMLLGQKPYRNVPAYMAACDVLIMPWNRSEWIRACNPVKLKEYLAVGRPIVSTWFSELEHYDGFVRVADGTKAFSNTIRQALEYPEDPERLRSRVRGHTWGHKSQAVLDFLAEQGIQPKAHASR